MRECGYNVCFGLIEDRVLSMTACPLSLLLQNTTSTWKYVLPRLTWVFLLALISWAGSEELDNFVALIGAFCCVPLAFIYPSLLHVRLLGGNLLSRCWDWFMVVLAFGTLVFCSYEAINTWGSNALCGPE